jgi:hypothetical protein
VGQHVADVYLTTIEVDGCDQAILISADVENREIIHTVSGWKRFSQLRKAAEISRGDKFVPTAERLLTLRFVHPKVSQCFAGNDVHFLINYIFGIGRFAIALPLPASVWRALESR